MAVAAVNRTERLRELRAHQAWLWQRFRRGDQTAREQLIKAYAPLVGKTRQRLFPYPPPRIDPGDLEAAGYVALVKAVDHFDPGRGIRPESYLIGAIRGAIFEHLRREDWVPRGVRAAQKMLRAAEAELGPGASDEDVAAFLGVSVEKLEQLREKANELRQVSLELSYDEASDEPLTVAEAVADPAPGPEDLAMDAVEWGAVSLALRHLPDSEREIIGHYYSGAGPTAIAHGDDA
jgi:RNA polymerase sigma factor for flagellar operon FliA